jgi:hypothetical protein
MYRRSPLTRPLHLTDGRVLRTLDDAGQMILSLSAFERAMSKWQRAAGMLKVAIQTGRDDHLTLASAQVEQALSSSPFGNVLLQHRKKPAARSVRGRVNERKRRRA